VLDQLSGKMMLGISIQFIERFKMTISKPYNLVNYIQDAINDMICHCDEKFYQSLGLDLFLDQLARPIKMMAELKDDQAEHKKWLTLDFKWKMLFKNPHVLSRCRLNAWTEATMFGWETPAVESTDGLTMKAHLQACYTREFRSVKRFSEAPWLEIKGHPVSARDYDSSPRKVR